MLSATSFLSAPECPASLHSQFCLISIKSSGAGDAPFLKANKAQSEHITLQQGLIISVHFIAPKTACSSELKAGILSGWSVKFYKNAH